MFDPALETTKQGLMDRLAGYGRIGALLGSDNCFLRQMHAKDWEWLTICV